MLKFFRPERGDIPELKSLYLSCFDEMPEAAEYMFSVMLSHENAYAAKSDSEIVSALYLLPCMVSVGDTQVKSHYLMGASTKEQYRGMGIMKRLICFALDSAKKFGDEFSVLKPAQPSLYSYYARLGYREFYTSSLFKYYRFNDTENIRKVFRLTNCLFDIWSKLRFNMFKNISGSVLWDSSHFADCAKINQIYGGGVLGFDCGYAFYTVAKDGIFVDELVCEPEYTDVFLWSLLSELKADMLTIRCPVFLKKDGHKIPMGMILPLSEKNKFEFDINPYLGLSLD